MKICLLKCWICLIQQNWETVGLVSDYRIAKSLKVKVASFDSIIVCVEEEIREEVNQYLPSRKVTIFFWEENNSCVYTRGNQLFLLDNNILDGPWIGPGCASHDGPSIANNSTNSQVEHNIQYQHYIILLWAAGREECISKSYHYNSNSKIELNSNTIPIVQHYCSTKLYAYIYICIYYE